MFRFALYVLSILVLATQSRADTPLPLQGSALYQRLGNDVYLASVFSASADEQQWRQPGTVVALRMDILTDHLSPRRFYRLWNEGLAINLSEAELSQWSGAMTRFINLLPEDLVAGDQVLISNQRGDCRVRINGIEVLQLPDGAFANLLLAAWIGKFPQSPALREGLISLPPADRAGTESALAARHFAAGRDQVVQGWLAPAAVAAAPSPRVVPAAAVVVPAAAMVAASAAVPVTKEKPAAKPAAVATPVQKPTPVAAVAPAPAVAAESAVERKPAGSGAAAAVVPAAVPAVPAAGEGAAHADESPAVAGQLASARYLRSILRHANSKAVYPERALRHRLEGTVMVAITLDEAGQVLNAETVQSSGSALLDQAAVRAAKQAAPYPQPPALLTADALEFDLPFRFALAH